MNKIMRRMWNFCAGFTQRVVFILVLLASTLISTPAASQGNAPLTELEIRGPGKVTVGEPINLVFTLKRASDIAGYETAVLFDPNVAEFGGLQQRDNDLKKFGRDVNPLTAVDLPGGVAFGLYTCPVADCVNRKGPKVDKGGNGTIRLTTLMLYAKEPGSLEIKLDATKFVDAQGNPVQVNIPNPTLVIQVDDASPDHPAPSSMWSLSSSAATNNGPFDLTGDGRVTNADVMEIALQWELTRQNAAPCLPDDPSRDVNHDGCIDVADLQLAAAHYNIGAEQPAENQSVQSTGQEKSFLPFVSGTGIASTNALTSSVFTVNAKADGSDGNIGDGRCATAYGYCTLRAAIQESNAHQGPDTINFSIYGNGVITIQLLGVLPAINDESGPTTIDGYTQPGSAPNTDPQMSNAVIHIQIAGNGETRHDGLVITSSNNVIRGVAIYKMKRAIWIYGSGAKNNVISGDFIGTDAAGNYGAASLVTGAHGLHIEQGASQNQIGGTSAADRNVISGNGQSGVGFWHEGTNGNVVINNLAGLGPAGDKRLPNRKHGVDINYGASYTQVGGTGSGEPNVCSGNDASGIEVSHTTGTDQNQVVGNLIGTDTTGNSLASWSYNGYTGITLEDGVSNNTVSNNVIGGNKSGGIQITGFYTANNQIYNNRVGISLNNSPIGNSLFGIRADGRSNKIGPNNIIAYNQYTGIVIREDDKDYNTITQNSTYNNGALGIDLNPGGVTPNDPGDVDTGPNENLNFPVLSNATTTQITGTACSGCTVEIFVADSGASAYGEGKKFVGSATANGSGSFSVPISGVNHGDIVTSTATDSTGNTSEFSQNIRVP